MSDNGRLDQGESSGGEEKGTDSGQILKVEPEGRSDTLDVVCERKRKKSRMTPRVWAREFAGGGRRRGEWRQRGKVGLILDMSGLRCLDPRRDGK